MATSLLCTSGSLHQERRAVKPGAGRVVTLVQWNDFCLDWRRRTLIIRPHGEVPPALGRSDGMQPERGLQGVEPGEEAMGRGSYTVGAKQKERQRKHKARLRKVADAVRKERKAAR